MRVRVDVVLEEQPVPVRRRRDGVLEQVRDGPVLGDARTIRKRRSAAFG